MTWPTEFRILRRIAFISAAIVGSLATVFAALAAIWWMVISIAPSPLDLIVENEIQYRLVNLISKGGLAVVSDSDESDMEYGQVAADREKIVNRILACAKAEGIEQLPRTLEIGYFGRGYAYAGASPSPYPIIQEDQPASVKLDDEQVRLLARASYLSDTISAQRLAFYRQSKESYFHFEVAAFAQILIGFLTTVIVSLTSAKIAPDKTLWDLSLRVLAVLFPAIGTAAAAIIAFYGPSASYATSRQAADGLAALQRQVSDGLYRLDCPTGDATASGNTKLSGQLDLWEDQLAAVAKTNPSGQDRGGQKNDQDKGKEGGGTQGQGNVTNNSNQNPAPPAATPQGANTPASQGPPGPM